MKSHGLGLAVTLAIALAPLNGALADQAHDDKASTPKELEALKKLAGRWEGKGDSGGKEMPIVFTYEVTAGGSAVIERMFAGTPHEMITVYTAEANKPVLTHYCMMGNHPKMTLTKGDDKSLSFEASGAEGLRSASEPHMHAMTVSWPDSNHLRSVWTSFEGGHKKDEKVFELTRKK
jgi:hypothetical protein